MLTRFQGQQREFPCWNGNGSSIYAFSTRSDMEQGVPKTPDSGTRRSSILRDPRVMVCRVTAKSCGGWGSNVVQTLDISRGDAYNKIRPRPY